MKRPLKQSICWVLSFVLVVLTITYGVKTGANAAEKTEKTIRIGYVEGIQLGSFAQLILKIACFMEEEGSIREGFSEKYADVDYELAYEDGDMAALWEDICDYNVEGGHYQFVREACFNMEQMAEEELPEIVNRNDVDLMFAMGTVAGEYLRDHETKNNYMVMVAADPIASKIVKSETERYAKNAYALIDNTAYQRQIEAGYKFLHFQKLGIVCEDSKVAYLYSAIDVVRQKAKELGFEMLIENVDEPTDEEAMPAYYNKLKKAYRRLIKQGADTIYITFSPIDYENKMQELLDDAIIPNHIKTLAQDESLPVRNGVLFGMSQADSEELAFHVTRQLARYTQEGVPFDQLDMVCECTPKLFLNYQTAQRIDFELSFENLQLMDTIYR